MAKHKIDIEKLESAAGRLRAIAHPMRIAILGLLNEEPMNVTSIYTHLQIEQASASHHLNILKNKGLIASRRDGKNTFYSLKQAALMQIIECVDRCDEF